MRILKLLLITFLASASVAMAGNEGGNGGQSIYVGENAFLRDIVERNNCLWKSPNMVKKTVPELKTVMAFIEENHWLLDMKIREAMGALKFCFTERRLPPLSYNNSDDLYIFTNTYFDQPAINDEGTIFIDVNLFRDMSGEHQAFLILHELSHEFFEKTELRRKREPRLRQFIMNLHDQYLKGTDYETFVMNIEQAKMARMTADIKKYDRSFVEKILSYEEEAPLQMARDYAKARGYQRRCLVAGSCEGFTGCQWIYEFKLDSFHRKVEEIEKLVFSSVAEAMERNDFKMAADLIEAIYGSISSDAKAHLNREIASKLNSKLEGEQLAGMKKILKTTELGLPLLEEFFGVGQREDLKGCFKSWEQVRNLKKALPAMEQRKWAHQIASRLYDSRWHQVYPATVFDLMEEFGLKSEILPKIERNFADMVGDIKEREKVSWVQERRHQALVKYIFENFGSGPLQRIVSKNQKLYFHFVTGYGRENYVAEDSMLRHLSDLDTKMRLFPEVDFDFVVKSEKGLEELGKFEDFRNGRLEEGLVKVFSQYDYWTEYGGFWGQKYLDYYHVNNFSQDFPFRGLRNLMNTLEEKEKIRLKNALIRTIKKMELRKDDEYKNLRKFKAFKLDLMKKIAEM